MGDNEQSSIKSIVGTLCAHLPELNPQAEWDTELDGRIEALLLDDSRAVTIEQSVYGLSVQSGLHLWNESLDKSHAIAQEIANPTGSYWHGMMHRMEGDYSNAKYWFGDVGHHPIFTELVNGARELVPAGQLSRIEHEGLRSKLEVLVNSPVWNACVFIDAVELQTTLVQNPLADEWLRHIQRYEMKLLLQHGYEKYCGGSLFEAI